MKRPTFLHVWRKEISVAVAVAAVLIAPFVLKTAGHGLTSKGERRLVIITPHHERIRAEFADAFVSYWKAKTGKTVFIDWRVPGGTSEIARMVKSDYAAAFQFQWKRVLSQEWTAEVANTFMNPKAAANASARAAFLKSDVSIGADLFFGGGSFDFDLQAEAGTLVAQGKGRTGLAAVREKHPEWFTDSVIPEKVSGESYRDPQNRWCGTCLSSFGIVYNRDVLRRLGIKEAPKQWRDLADPRLQGQVALADPGRSASVTKAFEMLIQQEIQKAIARLQANPGKRTPEQAMDAGIREGWEEGLRLIQRISANARSFSDTATKIPLDVAHGDAAVGMCIDFYGRSLEEDVRGPDGASRIGFVMPVGGTSISVDPIGMFRGAPDPELATAFMEFVLSPEGQKLWAYRAGAPGGPKKYALRRLPVRRDLYAPEMAAQMVDGNEKPYEKASAFTYHPEWTGSAFNALRFVLRVLCVDTHEEQRAAWAALNDADQPSRAVEVFQDLNLLRYDTVLDSVNRTVRSRDKVAETRLARQLGDSFRSNYQLATKLARQGSFSTIRAR